TLSDNTCCKLDSNGFFNVEWNCEPEWQCYFGMVRVGNKQHTIDLQLDCNAIDWLGHDCNGNQRPTQRFNRKYNILLSCCSTEQRRDTARWYSELYDTSFSTRSTYSFITC